MAVKLAVVTVNAQLAASTATVGTSKRWTVRLAAAVGAVFWGFLFFGLIDLMVPVDRTPGFYESYLLETGWGVLYFGLVAVPLMSVIAQASLRSPLAQVAIAGAAVGIAAVWSGAWDQLLAAAGLLCAALVIDVLSHNGVRRTPTVRLRLKAPKSPQQWLMSLTALASVAPAVVFAWDMVLGFREGRPPRDDITAGLDHWPMQGALALSLPLMALLACRRPSGWRVTGYTTAAGAAWLGGFSVAYPAHAGSLGTLGGWLAIGLSALFAFACTLPVRRVTNSQGS